MGRPVLMPSGAIVRYLDKYPREVSARDYMLDPDTLPVPEILDDGEKLTAVPDDSLDFLIACHMLEHCEDVIGTLRVHISKIRPGGILFYALPDKERTDDRPRQVTPLDHILADYRDGGRGSHDGHVCDWELFSGRQTTDLSLAHVHVWDAAAIYELFGQARLCLPSPAYRVEYFENLAEYPEALIVLRRN